MADAIKFDLAALKAIFQDGFRSSSNGLYGCVAEVTIGPEMLAAIRAGELGAIVRIVEPSELGSALFAAERD